MSVFSKRVQKLQQIMKKQEVQACFFFHYTEIAYFTGCSLGNFLFIPADNSPIIFTRKVPQRIQNFVPNISVVVYRSYKDLLDSVQPNQFSQSKIAIPLANTSYAHVEKFLTSFGFSSQYLVDAQPLLNQTTLIKTEEEIASIKKANQGIAQILSGLKAEDVLGKTEAHISGLLYAQLKDIGFIGEYQFRSMTPFIGPVVLTKDAVYTLSNAETTYSGKGLNPILATGSGHNIIEKDIPFVIDIMNNQEGLFADVTRTFIVGSPSVKLQKRHQDLIKIFEAIQSWCKVGNTFSQIYEQTLLMVQDLGYQDHFMGLKPNQSAFIGHNIGAWVDELPAFSKNMNTALAVNMTFALEPKFYFEDFDSSGLESTFVQREDFLESLTPLSSDLIIL